MLRELDYSVVIPLYNAERYIVGLINSYQRQSIKPKQIILIDSTANDKSELLLNTISVDESVSVIYEKISKEQFSHSLTRNYAASLSTADVILFTVQDALPKTGRMMEMILDGFTDSTVACVFARHEAYDHAAIVTKLEIDRCFDSFKSMTGCYTIQNKANNPDGYTKKPEWFWFNSDVCSAVKRSVFNDIKFRSVPYAEDQVFGKDVIEAGYSKVFANDAIIIHSHDYTLLQNFKRAFDENRGMMLAVGKGVRISLVSFIPIVFRNICRDFLQIQKGKYSLSFQMPFYIIAYHFIKYAGYFMGKHYKCLPSYLQTAFSLERTAYK